MIPTSAPSAAALALSYSNEVAFEACKILIKEGTANIFINDGTKEKGKSKGNTALHFAIMKKYTNLAREALSNGDKILSENYFQHAEHFIRILGEREVSLNKNQESKVKSIITKEEIEDLNYNIIAKGQKSYNGVAILSKFPVSDIKYTLPNFEEDEQARYIEGWINIENKGLRVASIYAPNGNPISSDKFTYKKTWLEKFFFE